MKYVVGFNPRPRAGGDLLQGAVEGGRSRFNPRPRAGGDLGHLPIEDVAVQVSIRAPARGATRRPGCTCRAASGRFNPRPRAGGDGDGPCVGRRGGFNPRPRAGGDGNSVSHSPPTTKRPDCANLPQRRSLTPIRRSYVLRGGIVVPSAGVNEMRESTDGTVLAPSSRKLIRPWGHRDRRRLSHRCARPSAASSRRAGRTVSCPGLR